MIGHFTRPSVLYIIYLIFKLFKKCSHHGNNDKCMILADMQRSHPHIILYQEVIFLIWDGRIFSNVELLMIILLSLYLDSFSPHSPGGLTMIL